MVFVGFFLQLPTLRIFLRGFIVLDKIFFAQTQTVKRTNDVILIYRQSWRTLSPTKWLIEGRHTMAKKSQECSKLSLIATFIACTQSCLLEKWSVFRSFSKLYNKETLFFLIYCVSWAGFNVLQSWIFYDSDNKFASARIWGKNHSSSRDTKQVEAGKVWSESGKFEMNRKKWSELD